MSAAAEPSAQKVAPHSVEAEQALVGGLLLEPGAWAEVAGVCTAADFYRPDLRVAFAAIAERAEAGLPFDVVLLEDELEREGKLAAVGGRTALKQLVADTAGSVNVRAYAEKVAERAKLRRLLALSDEIVRAVADRANPQQIVAALRSTLESLAASEQPQAERCIQIVLRPLAQIVSENREADWIEGLYEVLERRVLAVLAGARNTFKSFIGLHWALSAAIEQQPVVILSAEGAGLDRRAAAWMRTHAPAVNLESLPIVALERAVNLNSARTLADLHRGIEEAQISPALVLIDTLSKYAPGLDENDNAAVALYLSTLSASIRERYGCTVLLIAHSGHGDSRRPRGASVLMANPDSEYIVERPEPTALTATVTRERFKDAPALAPLAYTAEVIELGRTDRHGKPVTSLAMRAALAQALPAGRIVELRGKAQRQLLAALRARTADGQHPI